ncbi:hypothetical protein [Halosolutus gelatinilyticus]|uniref:hypothetical protein n=1 Tax=Halosolutus gelatinilyticus TaxID=2931975 RepID=UPI001FF6B899|nr:hypothetical protein [Halosolutus gelatinilyticus]
MVQDDDDDARVLVFAYDYEAGAEFNVVSQLETSTTVSILQTTEGENVPEISQPDEYTGHVIRYNGDDPPLAPTTLLFTQDSGLGEDDSGTLSDDASMFSTTLNLLETSLE